MDHISVWRLHNLDLSSEKKVGETHKKSLEF